MEPPKCSSASPSPAHSPSTDPPPSDVFIIQECNRALEFLRGGDHTKALELVDSYLSRDLKNSSTLLHSVRIHILYATASQIHDSAARIESIKKALESSSRGLALSPNSISFALIHANLLFELAQNDGGSYDAVVQQCQHGLLIENPAVPASAVEKLRKELLSLLGKSKILVECVERKRFLEDNALAMAEVKKEFQALLRKKKVIKKVGSNFDTIGRVKSYWNDSMSLQSKRELLRNGIDEVKAYLDKKKLVMAKKIFTEAVDYAKEAKKWKFWKCCCCGEKSFDGVWEHIRTEHLGSPSERFPEIVLQRTHQWAVDMIKTGNWRPVDSVNEWHYIDDDERTKLIDRIREMLILLIRYQFLASRHFDMLQELIIELLQKHIPNSVMTDSGLDKTLQSVCFLDVPDLKHVLEFLEDLGSAYELHCLRESEDQSDEQGFWADVRERIGFNGDFSSLVFDERLLRGDIVDPDNGNAVVTCNAKHRDANGDSFVDWLWMKSPTIREQLQEWEIVRQASTSQAMEFFKIFKAEDQCYQRMCERKNHYIFYWYELEHVKRMCAEENMKREQISEYHLHSYSSLLLKRQKEIESEGTGFGVYVAWSILKEAQTDTEIRMQINKRRDQAAREVCWPMFRW
jgi:hypothetical protein